MSEQPDLTVATTMRDLPVDSGHVLARYAEPALVGLTGLLLASVVAASNGGYFSDSWAWVAFISLCVATLRVILFPALPLRRLDWSFAAGLAAFAGWVALSTLWSPAATPTVDATIRDASYAAAVLALLLIVRPRTVEALLCGALLGVTVVSSYSLLTRLHPDWVGNWDLALFEGYRLSGPVGYWNALGLYCAMGVLLAIGLVARSQHRVVQAVAGATPVLLVPTILFTFSRGAWLGLIVGLAAALALDPRRLQLAAAALTLALCPAVVLVLVLDSNHLTDRAITLPQAADEGGALLPWILVLAAVSAIIALAFRWAGTRVHPSARSTRTIGGTVFAVVAVALLLTFVVVAPPWTLMHRASDSYAGSTDATGRLFDLRSNGRVELWRVSIDQFQERPVVGQGAGSYEPAWNQQRDVQGIARNAHSLYLEVLGELGVTGLALLVIALAVPLVAAVRARRTALVTAALAAYIAFLTVAAVDWDWQLAGVTLVALAAGVAVVVAARRDDAGAESPTLVRIGLPVVTGVLALLALAAVLSTVPLSRARSAYNRLDFTESAAQAQKASDWAPWSSEALDILGRSQLAQGKIVAAHASLRKAVDRSPNDWELWRDLAAASPPAEARAAVRRALALNPLERELVEFQQALTPAKTTTNP